MSDRPPESSPSSDNEASHEPPKTSPPQDSYVKLAMRNMVRKGGKSLSHFALTTLGLLGVLVAISYLTR